MISRLKVGYRFCFFKRIDFFPSGFSQPRDHQERLCHSLHQLRMWACIQLVFSFLSSRASPCLSSGVFLVFCPMELECAGNHLVVCLRTADVSSFKMNYWERNCPNFFSTESHFVICWLVCWGGGGGGSLSGFPISVVYPGPTELGLAGPEAENSPPPRQLCIRSNSSFSPFFL